LRLRGVGGQVAGGGQVGVEIRIEKAQEQDAGPRQYGDPGAVVIRGREREAQPVGDDKTSRRDQGDDQGSGGLQGTGAPMRLTRLPRSSLSDLHIRADHPRCDPFA
jgi:hypothetical protein